MRDTALQAPTARDRVLMRLADSRGWRRNLALFVIGLVCALSFPPVGLLPLIVVGLALLLLMLTAAPCARRAFADGWWFSYGLGVAGMYWIAISMTVDLAKFGWMIPLAVFGLTGFLALYAGLASWLTWLVPAPRRCQRVVTFAILWTLGEMLRGTLFTGFPWNVAGNAWSQWDITLQPAALVGSYGLSLWTALTGAVLAWPFLRRHLGAPTVLKRRFGVYGALAMLLLPLVYGGVRLSLAGDYASPLLHQPSVQLRLVQPSVAQELKWDPVHMRETVTTLLSLSKLENTPAPTHVFWPEAALPFRLAETPALVRDLAAAAPERGSILTGGVRVERDENGAAKDIFNTMEIVGSDGTLGVLYDKMSLVPFGEFVPLRDVLPLQKITPGGRDFTSGRRHGPIALPGLPPAAPLICYEIIFPAQVRDQAQPNGIDGQGEGRAQWILNITNDAWFGTSSGPFQHFGMARMRAVELGLPLVRVANNGITAIVDPYGRVLERLPLNARGVLDAPLPKPMPGRTLYAATGYVPLWVMTGLLLILAGLSCWRRRA